MKNNENHAVKLLAEHIAQLEDPRGRQGRLHKFQDVLIIGILVTICGADEWTETEMYAKSKQKFLEQILDLPNGIPSHDTFGRIFGLISQEEFQKYFSLWIQDLCGEIINIDGKQLRRSYSTKDDKAAIYMVSAWANANNMVLGQVKVAEKSNEITAIPKLLKMLDLTGAIITIDAMGCQAEIAEKIIESDANYVLAVKGNQGSLFEEIVEAFEKVGGNKKANKHSYAQTTHGRQERRTAYALNVQDWISKSYKIEMEDAKKYS